MHEKNPAPEADLQGSGFLSKAFNDWRRDTIEPPVLPHIDII
jgi:hypothetical protein